MAFETLMFRKNPFSTTLLLYVLAASLFVAVLNGCSEPAPPATATAHMGDIRIVTSTNGIVEPINSSLIFASADGFIRSIDCGEGSETKKGQTLFRIDSTQARISLAEARAALLEARRQAKVVLEGPPREELDALDASINESRLQLRQLSQNLSEQESLQEKGAVSMESVENLREQLNLLKLRTDGLSQNRENLIHRYSDADKELMRGKIEELTSQVDLLERQMKNTTVVSPSDGLLFGLEVKPGSYVTTGQLLAQIYRPGEVRLRAYVDEPDLGRIEQGQPVEIEWDGMPGIKLKGNVEKTADRVVAMNNRSVGYVLCSIDEMSEKLIPDINVDVDIVTASKENTLVVPRSSVFRNEGESVVLLSQGAQTVLKPVVTGLTTYDEIEILDGIEPGDVVVLNPLNNLPQE
jgi:HlyD family secretion protein